MALKSKFAFALLSLICVVDPASAETLDSLLGQFTFDWHSDPDKAKCAVVDDKMLAQFKSDAYQCNLEVITNTASEEPARVCTQRGEGAEYLIFASMKSCEAERETQVSNAE